MSCKISLDKVLILSCLFDSSANAKKWETELQTLKNNNARLTAALQESTTNVEEWKKQLNAYKEENIKLRKKVHACTKKLFFKLIMFVTIDFYYWHVYLFICYSLFCRILVNVFLLQNALRENVHFLLTSLLFTSL